MRKLTIGLFTDFYYPYLSGVTTAIEGIAKGLAKRGHKVIIFCPKYKGNYVDKKIKNITYVRLPALSAIKVYEDVRLAFPLDPRVLRALIRHKVDVLHFHTPATIGLEAISLSKLLNLPLVGTFHTFIADPDYLSYVKIKSPFMQRVAWDYSNMYYNACDLISSPSLQTKKEMMRNRCRRPVKVISNGIDLSMFDNRKASSLRKKLGLTKGRTVLYVGRVGLEKNIGYLLESFKAVAHAVSGARLLIVGDGPLTHDLKQRSRQLGIENNVLFLGKIPHDELIVSGIFGASDIFATASLTENQPVTILEAQANGLVCVGIAAKGIPDLIIDGKNGHLLKRGDMRGFSRALIRLMLDKEHYQLLRKGTFEEVKKHDMQHVMDEWEKTYLSLVERSEKKRRKLNIPLDRYKKTLKALFSQKIKI